MKPALVQGLGSVGYNVIVNTSGKLYNDEVAARCVGQRITGEDITEALSHLDPSQLQCFVCGPPPMIADIEQMLEECHVTRACIHTEKWW